MAQYQVSSGAQILAAKMLVLSTGQPEIYFKPYSFLEMSYISMLYGCKISPYHAQLHTYVDPRRDPQHARPCFIIHMYITKYSTTLKRQEKEIKKKSRENSGFRFFKQSKRCSRSWIYAKRRIITGGSSCTWSRSSRIRAKMSTMYRWQIIPHKVRRQSR